MRSNGRAGAGDDADTALRAPLHLVAVSAGREPVLRLLPPAPLGRAGGSTVLDLASGPGALPDRPPEDLALVFCRYVPPLWLAWTLRHAEASRRRSASSSTTITRGSSSTARCRFATAGRSCASASCPGARCPGASPMSGRGATRWRSASAIRGPSPWSRSRRRRIWSAARRLAAEPAGRGDAARLPRHRRSPARAPLARGAGRPPQGRRARRAAGGGGRPAARADLARAPLGGGSAAAILAGLPATRRGAAEPTCSWCRWWTPASTRGARSRR